MICETLKALRVSSGFTQEEIADKLGMKQRTYSNYETGVREPNALVLMRIADYYNVTVDYILGRSKKEKAPAPAATGTGAEDEVDEQKLDELVGLIHGWLVESGQLKEGEDIDPLRAKLLVAIIKAMFE